MKKVSFIIVILALNFNVSSAKNPETHESRRSPVHQVFQFMQSGTCTEWADSSKTKATLYLWIPETCKQLRGLLILCNNVPEHMLVGHAAIRKVCEENKLGIIWSTPSFMNFRKTITKEGKTLNMALEYTTTVNFLQQMLNGLAETSGYAEAATVPWLPMGESGHLLMVDALMEQSPERCMAGIFIKNNHLPPKNRTVPALVAFGTAQEWGQDKVDIRTRWNDVGSAYEGILKQRKDNPNWPLSYVIDGSSGHFDCSEKLVNYFARYIDLVSKARLSDDGSSKLKPIALEKGFLADMPVPGHENHPVMPYTAGTEASCYPWFFDQQSALEAQSFAQINWKATTQIPAFLYDSGKIVPFIFNGISKLVPTDMGDNGITFSFQPVMLNQIPANFTVGAGEKLSKTNEIPVLEWTCGQFKPIGNNKFRISLDRMYPTMTSYLGVRQKGNDSIRAIFQPGGLTLSKNNVGKPQKISFVKIQNVIAGTKSIPLVATSDSGLPVDFYVVAGPAIVENGKLVFTKIPPKSTFPVKVTVAAWQWGRANDPKIKTTEIIKQEFDIIVLKHNHNNK